MLAPRWECGLGVAGIAAVVSQAVVALRTVALPLLLPAGNSADLLLLGERMLRRKVGKAQEVVGGCVADSGGKRGLHCSRV